MRGVPTDVPIHRTSVGAMGWMGNQNPSPEASRRGYIYRGTGEDTLTPDLDEEGERERKREVARKKREVKKRKRMEEQAAHLERLRQERFTRQREAVERAKAREVSEKQADLQAEYDAAPLAKVIPLFGPREDESDVPAPAPVRPPKRRTPRPGSLRPSAGWKPPSGSDLDAWLDD